MRRITFYLVISFLAFGIGSLFAVCLYQNNSLKLTVEKTSYEGKIVQQNTNEKISETKFGCEDEATKTVWNKLEEDEDFTADAYPVIEARQIKNCQELFDRYSADLNDDNISEIVLKGNYILFCNSGADCRSWIVSKISGKYRIIFEATVGEPTDGLQFLPEKTNKFQNIKVKLNNGFEEDNIGIFKFNGKKYQIKNCFIDVNSDFGLPFDYEVRPEKLVSVKLDKCL